jgi:hypothetical protein
MGVETRGRPFETTGRAVARRMVRIVQPTASSREWRRIFRAHRSTAETDEAARQAARQPLEV